jgi:hypothetical protein
MRSLCPTNKPPLNFSSPPPSIAEDERRSLFFVADNAERFRGAPGLNLLMDKDPFLLILPCRKPHKSCSEGQWVMRIEHILLPSPQGEVDR